VGGDEAVSDVYDQIAIALHHQLVKAGPVEDEQCGLIAAGVYNCINALAMLFHARDQLAVVLGAQPEFDMDRFLRLANEGLR
jgi:hypothetical protein